MGLDYPLDDLHDSFRNPKATKYIAVLSKFKNEIGIREIWSNQRDFRIKNNKREIRNNKSTASCSVMKITHNLQGVSVLRYTYKQRLQNRTSSSNHRNSLLWQIIDTGLD